MSGSTRITTVSRKTSRKAFISGITGQDGSYLAEFLLAKGYEVHGIIRRTSTFNTDRLDHIYSDPHEGGAALHLHYGDLANAAHLSRLFNQIQPDEVYNLGAQSHVRTSFDQAEYTADVVATGTLRLLEAFREYAAESGREPRFYQAGSSEMFGASPPPQNETTPFYPRSPYAVSKLAAHWYAINQREAYNLFICNGILFNHESPRRGETFVTRKITRALGRIKFGLQGDASKARQALGWQAEISFEELVRSMVEHDLELARQEQTLLRAGHTINLGVEPMAEHVRLAEASRVFVAG